MLDVVKVPHTAPTPFSRQSAGVSPFPIFKSWGFGNFGYPPASLPYMGGMKHWYIPRVCEMCVRVYCAPSYVSVSPAVSSLVFIVAVV